MNYEKNENFYRSLYSAEFWFWGFIVLPIFWVLGYALALLIHVIQEGKFEWWW